MDILYTICILQFIKTICILQLMYTICILQHFSIKYLPNLNIKIRVINSSYFMLNLLIYIKYAIIYRVWEGLNEL
jgi:hypothetical protein